MGFRFLRRIKILPGITLNVNKKSASVSFGGRGARVTIGPKGKRATVGIPGSGLSYTTTTPFKTSSKTTPHIKNYFCNSCGEMMLTKIGVCPKCGMQQKSLSTKNKTVAALLALFLGGIRIHKFYLGKTLQGIICLLLFWTGIPAIIGFIEAIIYYTMTEDKFAEKFPG